VTASPAVPPRPPRRLGLRARASVAFALIAMVLAVGLSALTYELARRELLDQRESVARDQAIDNAVRARSRLVLDEVDVPEILRTLTASRSTQPIIRYRGEWVPRTLNFQVPDDLPNSLVALVDSGRTGSQRVRVDDTPYVVIGVALPQLDAQYYEVFSLSELQRTLRALAVALGIGSVVVVVAGAGLGWYASRRVLRPLGQFASTARRLAGGELGARLDPTGDPDLAPIVDSFNGMAVSLEQRIDRDARFASNISHELRSPLTTLRASIDLMTARKDEMPERAQVPLELLESQVMRFERMVLDLLEISRLDAGVGEVDLEPLEVAELTCTVARGFPGMEQLVRIDPEVADTSALVDKRRFEQVIVNLIENARRHGKGVTRIVVERGLGVVRVAVEDAGPGVPPTERAMIFERFSRGAVGRHGSGAGLGLALVAEHVRLMRGTVRVEDVPDGGARFVVEVPVAVVHR
jgi:two-component system, OmpR family, sensor histidine kinase MtrB